VKVGLGGRSAGIKEVAQSARPQSEMVAGTPH
jgi:hypothetical protein